MTSVASLPRPRSRRTVVIGVLNVTPDSFSDGGLYVDLDGAVKHAIQLHDEGADLVDVGGESTRPGAVRVDVEEEIRRVLPVVRALVEAGVPCSVDTYRAAVASASLDAGASVRERCVRRTRRSRHGSGRPRGRMSVDSDALARAQ